MATTAVVEWTRALRLPVEPRVDGYLELSDEFSLPD